MNASWIPLPLIVNPAGRAPDAPNLLPGAAPTRASSSLSGGTGPEAGFQTRRPRSVFSFLSLVHFPFRCGGSVQAAGCTAIFPARRLRFLHFLHRHARLAQAGDGGCHDASAGGFAP